MPFESREIVPPGMVSVHTDPPNRVRELVLNGVDENMQSWEGVKDKEGEVGWLRKRWRASIFQCNPRMCRTWAKPGPAKITGTPPTTHDPYVPLSFCSFVKIFQACNDYPFPYIDDRSDRNDHRLTL